MRTLLRVGSRLLALMMLGAPASAFGQAVPAPATCCASAPCVTTKPCFHVEVVAHKCGQVPVVPPPYVAVVKESTREMPVTRCVPVTTCDPCTGCTRTEYRQEAIVEKVKVIKIDVCVNPAPVTCVDVIKTCTNITLEDRPVPAPPCEAAPACCTCSRCGHRR